VLQRKHHDRNRLKLGFDDVSFVEMIKINSEVKFSERPEITQLRNYRSFYDLTSSKKGSLKLQNMLKNVRPAYLTSPLKLEYNPLASLKGAALAQAERDFATKKIQKSTTRAPVSTTVQVTSAPRVRGRSVATTTTAPSTPTATTEATAPSTPVGGRADTDSNSGGGSTY
jgi:hypothetical protein